MWSLEKSVGGCDDSDGTLRSEGIPASSKILLVKGGHFTFFEKILEYGLNDAFFNIEIFRFWKFATDVENGGKVIETD